MSVCIIVFLSMILNEAGMVYLGGRVFSGGISFI